MKNFPLVSITIASKNEENNIANCLKSIKKQLYPLNKIEVIVVDNNSTDNTKKIAKKFTDKVFNKGPERSSQRNFGMIKQSQGKYLLYLDADMTISPQLIKRAVKKLETTKLKALYLKEIIPGQSYWNKVRCFERSFYNTTVIDGLRFFQKDIFIKTKGFDEKLSSFEDWDLDKRIKKIAKVGALDDNKAVIYHHEKQFNPKTYFKKKGQYIKNSSLYLNKWGQQDKDIKKQFSFYYRYFGVFIENGKWKKLIIKPHLTVGMYFLKISVGLTYLFTKIFNNK